MDRIRIRERAIIIEELKGGKFRLHLQDNVSHEIIATLCGKMLGRRINLCAGDDVSVELSPYDLGKGRITWRH